MNLRQFLHYLHDGAFSAWESVISDLTSGDLKALRLAIDLRLANAIFPYMFDRLFLSVHGEDHEVFTRISEHPTARQKITQICWDATVCKTLLVKPDTTDDDAKARRECRMGYYLQLLVRDRDVPSPDDTIRQLCQQVDSFHRALDFWTQREKVWLRVAKADLDLCILQGALSGLPALRRINIWAEVLEPCVPCRDYLRLWSTPRARSWARLPFGQNLILPRPKNVAHSRRYYLDLVRLLNGLSALARDERIDVGSIIIDSYGRGQLARFNPTNRDLRTQKFTDFDSIIDGFASTVSDLQQSHKLTLRLIMEIGALGGQTTGAYPNKHSLWVSRSAEAVWISSLDALALSCQRSLEEITYCRVNLDTFMEYYRKDDGSGNDIPHLANSTQLRRVRFYGCWCYNASKILHWIWHNTTIREVELHAVDSVSATWYAVMTDLRVQNITFDVFDVVSCRSATEIWGPDFSPDVLAPWSGESKQIVPWLRGETDSFPLWMGPG